MGAVNRFDVPDSILAPIVAAVPPGTLWAGFSNCAFAAQEAVPVAQVRYQVKNSGKFKRTYEVWERRLSSRSGQDAEPFSVRIRLADRAPARSGPITLGESLWEVGITCLKDGLCTPAVPEDYDTAILQTSILKYSPSGLSGAPQLALFRHLWVNNVLAAAPDAIVFGGQSHWSEQWWNETIPDSEEH